ncbi:RHS repeat-associated core domain-containing protein [Pseudomonas sp. FYR_11]|uniref:RHS repeat-associated core domain-containing protein n=1 Tax=Pseudomonas TaxID=286 RepID=UPI00370BF6F6
MKIQRQSLKLFYCGGYMHASLCDQGSRTVFRVAGQSLAELRIGSVDGVSLLSVDRAGSVTGVAQESGREQLAYTAYGHCSSLFSGRSLLGFNGEHYDDFSQGYLLGNGYRLFKGMRFNSPDSFAPFRVLNAYGYCNGDPINYTDSSGHMPNSSIYRGRVRGYYTTSQVMRRIAGAVSRLEAEIGDVKYHPRLGTPAKLEESHRTNLVSAQQELISSVSYLDSVIGADPDRYKRVINKMDALGDRAINVFSRFESAINSNFKGASDRRKAWVEVYLERKERRSLNRANRNEIRWIEEELIASSVSERDRLSAHNLSLSEIEQEIETLHDKVAELRRGLRRLPKYPEPKL